MKFIVQQLLYFFLVSIPCITIAQVAPQYEFRGVWVATVDNIDWPSRKDLSVEQQKAEFIALATMHKNNGMNALIVQIRSAADAFYPSKFEPWSEFLTGQQGIAPQPYYDPLQFMIEETHKRGMEFHAWLNPYRAVFNSKNSSIANDHITKTHPKWFLTYGGKKYFNPGLPEVRQYVAAIVKDIVMRYDIDAIHMDDYFYPYRIAGKEFPDEKTYRHSGSTLNKEDWRRSNCDSIIRLLSKTIKSINPRVKFGISPFGVWRNISKDIDGSNTQAGQTCYDDLYADIVLWLKKGWIDYVAPQLYWEIGNKLCDYTVLLDWWNKHTYGKHLYIGHAVYRAGTSKAWRNKDELPNEIKALRQYHTTQGSAFFSSKNFENNPNGWSDSLQLNYYATPAIIPPMPWIDSTPPSIPVIEKNKKNIYSILYKGTKKIKGFALYTLPKDIETQKANASLLEIIVSSNTATINKNNISTATNNRLFIAALDVNNNVSDWVELK